MQYYYDVTNGTVVAEDSPQRPRGAQLMGPYDTQEEAARALEIAAERTEQWDEQDRKDREWGEEPGS